MEVVIYSSLALLVLGSAVTILGRLHRSAFRNQEMSRVHGDAGEAISLIAQDIRNLGLKRVVYSPDPGLLVDTLLSSADYGPADSSSFLHKDGNPYDTLVFIKPQLDAVGKPISVDTIRYFVDPATSTLSRAANHADPVAICPQVDALQFEYGLYATKTTLVVEKPPAILHWSQNPAGTLSQSGSTLKAIRNSAGTSSFWISNHSVNLVANHTYRLEIQTMANAYFLDHVDSLYATLCNGAGVPVAKQSFLPSTTLSTQYLEWSGIACSGCYAGFRMETHGQGEFSLNSLQLIDVKQADGTWTPLPTTAEKKAVRSIRISLLARSAGEVFGIRPDTLNLANVQLHFHDDLGRALSNDVISIPNNGI